jgi:tetratricopeptide (TPR) repeat protein
MKRKLLISLWVLVPVLVLAYHYGPGQAALSRDRAAALAQKAAALEKAEDWAGAVEAYQQALAALPAEDANSRFKVRLAAANARLYTGELPEAMQDLDGLLSEMLKAGSPAPEVRDVRGALASAQYYAAWLMRLENAPTEEWMEQAENARQNFRLLAEQTQVGAPGAAEDFQKNLESVIRLQRMDLSELQGLPLPKKCQGCKNCSQKCRGQKESRCKNPGEKPKDARGAGVGKRPDGTGS